VDRDGVRPLAVLAATAALLLPACAGGEGEPPPAATATVTVTNTVSVTVSETLTTRTFQLPSREIGCRHAHRLLRCDILPGLEPRPNKSCDFDWVGLELGATGPTVPNCGSDTVVDQAAPTLGPGATWARSGIECEALRNSLHCANPEGHEFDLAPGRWTVS
jgi:hypothetical protein